jgi:transposase-like protein
MTKATAIRLKSSATRFGCISASPSVFGTVEELLAQRGIIVTYETVCQWCLKFGQTYANELHRRRPRCGDIWRMDEIVLTLRGKRHSLWRAVDQDGNVLDIWFRAEGTEKRRNASVVSCSKGCYTSLE